MATQTVPQTPKPTVNPEPVVHSRPLYFEAVTRANLPGGAVARFAEHVAEISTGLRIIMEVLARNEELLQEAMDTDAAETPPAPLLSKGQADNLNRFVRQSLSGLNEKASDLMVWAYEQHTPEGARAHMSRAGFSLARSVSTSAD